MKSPRNLGCCIPISTNSFVFVKFKLLGLAVSFDASCDMDEFRPSHLSVFPHVYIFYFGNLLVIFLYILELPLRLYETYSIYLHSLLEF